MMAGNVLAAADLDQMSREVLIQLYLDATKVLTAKMPLLDIPIADLAAWARVLDVAEISVRRRWDGRVTAYVDPPFPERGYLIVEATVDSAPGVELLPCEGDNQFGPAVRLPVGEAWRLSATREVA